mmetsp:Transcript_3781/g.6065  ORF Transcript_3781/g.6065 Transcript_3781/m.6065 type:complete len:209 (+) Transcript_3781:175-801(+)
MSPLSSSTTARHKSCTSSVTASEVSMVSHATRCVPSRSHGTPREAHKRSKIMAAFTSCKTISCMPLPNVSSVSSCSVTSVVSGTSPSISLSCRICAAVLCSLDELLVPSSRTAAFNASARWRAVPSGSFKASARSRFWISAPIFVCVSSSSSCSPCASVSSRPSSSHSSLSSPNSPSASSLVSVYFEASATSRLRTAGSSSSRISILR